MIGADSGLPHLWVLTECYPKPTAMHHCAFVHPQMVGLKEARWDVNVIIPNGWFPPVLWRIAPAWRYARANAIPREWSIDGISVSTVIYQNRVPSRLNSPLGSQARIVSALISELEARGANRQQDLLLVEFALPYGPVAREVSKALDLRYVVHLRGDDVWRLPHRDSAKRMTSFIDTLQNADFVLAVSRSLIDEAEHLIGERLPMTAVVPNGINLQRFQPRNSTAEQQSIRQSLGIGSGEVAVICVGDALLRKGWIELLDALGGLPDSAPPTVLLAVVGLSAAEVDIQAEARRRAPKTRLCFLQGLQPDKLAEVYRASDIFCLLSHWEGMANALLEAMASGLPVVTSEMAGHPEAVSNGVEGFLVPPMTVEPVKAMLVPLLQSPELRQRLGEASRRRAQAIGDSMKSGARLGQILEQVLRGDENSLRFTENPYASNSSYGQLSVERALIDAAQKV